MLLVNNCASSFVSYLCRIFALFPHMESIFTNLWALVYRSPFIQQNAMTVSWTENIFSVLPIAKVLLSLGKRTMKSTDKKKHSLMTIEYNWIADCSYCNFFLIRNMTVWLFNGFYLYLQFPEFAIIIGTIFAVYFLKYCAVFLAGTVQRKYIGWTYCSSALFFKHASYFVRIVKNCI